MALDVARSGKPLRLPLPLIRTALLVLAVLWLTWGAVRLFYLILGAVQAPPPAPIATAAVQAPPPPVDVESLIAAGWFGRAQATEQKVEDAPDSTAGLKLVSVWVATPPARGNAVIESPGGQGLVVAEGEDLEGGYGRLKQVMSDRVILDRNGRLETLRMPVLADSNLTLDVQQSPQGEQIDKRSDSRLKQDLKQLQQTLQNDPASLADVLRMEPEFNNGNLRGYRIAPGKDTKLFARFGLQRNDMLTAINGVPLSDPQQAMSLLQSLQTAREFNVTLERGGRPLNVLLSLE